MKALTAIALITTLSGCAVTPYQGYAGSAKSDKEVAIVRLWTPTQTNVFSSPGLLMQKIDGNAAGDVGRASHAYLLPGEHEFQIKLIQVKAYNLLCGALCDAIFNKPVEFKSIVEAGKIYVPKYVNDTKESVILEEQPESFDRVCLNPREYTKERC
ncbi:MAG: hypothetical protein HYU74_03970 [Dechloromonas sp.]|nr:hypothetical protein [Dechloromonas sp.]